MNAGYINAYDIDAARVTAGQGNFIQANAAQVNAGQVNAGSVNAGYINAYDIDAARVTAGAVNAGYINAYDIDAARVTAGQGNFIQANAYQVNAGQVNAGSVNAGYVNAYDIDAARVTAGAINAGYINAYDIDAARVTAGQGNFIQANAYQVNAGQVNAGSVNTGHLYVGGDATVNGQIHGVQDGTAPTDAVNVRQLNNKFVDFNSRIDRVGALAAAMSSLAPLDYDPEQPTQISMGAGSYSGRQAVAIGIFHYSKKDVMLNAGYSVSGSEKMGRVGVTWRTGGKKSQPATVKQDESVPVMAPAASDQAPGSRLLQVIKESKADEASED